MNKNSLAKIKRLETKPLTKAPQPLVADGEWVLERIGEPGMPGPVDPSSLTREERQAAVAVLLGAGWPHARIAKRMKVALSTVTQDVKCIRLRAADEGMGVTVKEIAGNFIHRLEYQYRKTMELFESIMEPRTRLAAIKLCLDIQRQQLEVYSKLGFKSGETDRRKFHQEVSAKTMVKVQQMMVVVERHVDEGERASLAGEWKTILSDIPLHTIEAEVL